jgi:hypothetical protein
VPTATPPADEDPYPLLTRMRGLSAPRARRLAEARALAEDPRRLVDELLRTVAQLSLAGPEPRRRRRPSGPALPLVRELDEVAHRERAPRTADFAYWLAREGRLEVAGAPDLDGDYVDREVRLAAASGQVVRVDLLLASGPRGARRPVVAEVKIAADKDPYAALVQALAGVAHLTAAAAVHALSEPLTSAYERLRAVHPAADFPAERPPIDAYVLCVDPDWRRAHMAAALEAVKEIAWGISADSRCAGIVRRAVVLELTREPGRAWTHARRL